MKIKIKYSIGFGAHYDSLEINDDYLNEMDSDEEREAAIQEMAEEYIQERLEISFEVV